MLRRFQAVGALGYDVHVLRVVPYAPPLGSKWAAYRSIPAFETIEGIPVHNVRAVVPPRLIGMEYLPLQLDRVLRREIERLRPDVVHASYLIPCGQLAVRARIPSVVTAHGVDAYNWPFQRPGLMRAAREAVNGATRVTAVSAYLARTIQSIAPRDVRVILNGGDERFFFPTDRGSARTYWDLPQDRIVIAFAGNVLRAKGVFDLIEAASAIKQHRPIVVFAGSGPDADDVGQAAIRNGIDVRFLGRLKQQDVARVFAAADIVTLPSYNEGLPNVVCEAMLCRRAIVATTVGGIPEIIENDLTGLLVEPGEPEQLARAFDRLASEEATRARLAEAAGNFAARRLTWRISALSYDNLYREMLDDVRPHVLETTV